MRWKLALAALCVAVVATRAAAEPPRPAPPGANPSLQRIRAFRDAGERKLLAGKLTRRTIALNVAGVREDIRQRWSKMDAYYEGPKLVRIQLYPYPTISGRTEEFYLEGGRLEFAYIQDKGPKHEGRDEGEPGKEMFFEGDRLIGFVDRSGEPVRDAEREKHMYETTLPYEVSELVWMLEHHR